MSPAQLCLVVLLAFVGAAMLGPAALMRTLSREDPTPMRRAALSLAVVPGFCLAAIPLLELGRPTCEEVRGQICRNIDPGVALVMFGAGAFFVALGLLYVPRPQQSAFPGAMLQQAVVGVSPSNPSRAPTTDVRPSAERRAKPMAQDSTVEIIASATPDVATPPTRVDGRVASLSGVLEVMASRLIEGSRVVLVSSGNVDERVHQFVEMLADELQATRSVVGSGDSPAHRLAGASALHEDALALALAGGAFDVVFFVDTLVGGDFNVERIGRIQSLALTASRNDFVDAARVALLCPADDHHTVSLALLREVQALRVHRARHADRIEQPMVRLSDLSIVPAPAVGLSGIAVSLSTGPALLSASTARNGLKPTVTEQAPAVAEAEPLREEGLEAASVQLPRESDALQDMALVEALEAQDADAHAPLTPPISTTAVETSVSPTAHQDATESPAVKAGTEEPVGHDKVGGESDSESDSESGAPSDG